MQCYRYFWVQTYTYKVYNWLYGPKFHLLWVKWCGYVMFPRVNIMPTIWHFSIISWSLNTSNMVQMGALNYACIVFRNLKVWKFYTSFFRNTKSLINSEDMQERDTQIYEGFFHINISIMSREITLTGYSNH